MVRWMMMMMLRRRTMRMRMLILRRMTMMRSSFHMRQERIREAESETSRNEVALLGSEAKIEKMEIEILHHDFSGVEETLGKVVERLKVLESE
nr:hypothetical protein [Tanacetum cinerariifolium]